MYGMDRDQENCLPVSSGSFSVNSIQGFTKPGYSACFFSSRDCYIENDADHVQMSGGDRIDGSDCLSLPNEQQINSFKVSRGGCERLHIWGLYFRSVRLTHLCLPLFRLSSRLCGTGLTETTRTGLRATIRRVILGVYHGMQ